MHTRLYHIFLFVVLSFSIFWDLMKFSPSEMFARFTTTFRFFMTEVVIDRAFYFIFKKRKVICGSFFLDILGLNEVFSF